MAPPRLVPDKTTLRRWQEEGLTHEQMAERVFEETGNRVTRVAISVALQRYGLTASAKRYDSTIPWRVREGHARAYPVRMLRLLGRRIEGLELTKHETTILDQWLAELDEQNLIVAYDYESDQGFVYIDRKYKDHRQKNLPIRKKQIHL